MKGNEWIMRLLATDSLITLYFQCLKNKSRHQLSIQGNVRVRFGFLKLVVDNFGDYPQGIAYQGAKL